MIYNHWSQSLEMALTATFIQSKILGVDFDEARENISYSVNVSNFDELDNFCWSICFMCPNYISVPYL